MNYCEAMQTRDKVYTIFRNSGIDAGVGLTVIDDSIALEVHSSKPIPQQLINESQKITRQDGIKVRYKETGEVDAY